jgi:cytoskeletal protein CcmA (bactofilin family)
VFRELLGGTKPKTTNSPVQAQQPNKSAAAPALPTKDTVLGTGAHLEGNLKTPGNVRVHGTFVGDITAQGKITIGEQGKLEGDLTGEAVDVAGQMHGNILARMVAVARTGQVRGDLRLEKLQTEEGAFVQGLVTMEEKITLPGGPEPEKPAIEAETAIEPDAKAELPSRPEQAPSAAGEQAAKPETKGKKEPAKAGK